MSAEVFATRFVETQDLLPDAMLEQAKGLFASAIVVGWDHSGELLAISSLASGPEALWLLQKSIHRLMSGDAHA